MRSRRIDPSVASANTSPSGPKPGGTLDEKASTLWPLGIDVKDPVLVVVHRDDPAGRVDAPRALVAGQVRVAGSAAADPPDDLAGRGELGQGLALVVRDVDVAGTVDHQVAREEELARPAPVAELADEPSLRGEDLDPAVSAVRDVDHPGAADGDPARHVCRIRGIARDELE